MTPKGKEEQEKEPLTDIIDLETLQILDDSVQKLEEEFLNKKQSELIEKADKQLEISKELSEEIKETTFYLDFFMTIIITAINPIFKKYDIEPISITESTELSHALLGILSEKTLNKSGQIGKAISEVINFPKFLKLFTIAWKMVFPRLTKHLENKKSNQTIIGK